MKLNLKYFLFLMAMLFSLTAFAADPVAVLSQTSDQMLSALKSNKSQLKANPDIVFKIVNRILLPHVDLETMSRSVVGRTAWGQATSEQKTQFKNLFTHQVTKTYASALSSYQNEQVKFYPIRGGVSGNRVQVQSAIIRASGQTIPVNYRLVNENGQWKVYDFSVEGVSIVQSYQSQFADVLTQSGMTGLLNQMKQRYAQ